MSQIQLLNKWRHLIEPVVLSSVTPISWDAVCAMELMVYEGKKSVILAHDKWLGPRFTRSIWVAAGELEEVIELVERVCEDAKQAGLSCVSYVGRRGWVRAAGFDEAATVGIREL